MRKVILTLVFSFFLLQLLQCVPGNVNRSGKHKGGNTRPVRGDENKALNHLRKARAALKRASRNKGGHRVRALKKTNRAIRQLQSRR